MSAIEESDLRAGKERGAEALADLARQSGQLPDARKIEDFMTPIMQKITHDEHTVKPAPKPTDKQITQDEWYGEAGHSPLVGRGRIAPSRQGESLKVTSKVLGEYTWNAQPLNGAPTGQQQPASRFEAMVRFMVKELCTLPEWRMQFEAIALGNMNPQEREKAYRKLLANAVRLFGAPMPSSMREAKIISVGK